jgi:hypothetical protein
MAEQGHGRDDSHSIETDLVEYVVVTVPDRESLPALQRALRELVGVGAIRVLDLVGLAREADGSLVPVDFTGSDPAPPDPVDGDAAVMLTDHDVQLAALAVRPGMAGIVVLTEGRWAEPLSIAAHRAGGQIVGGERIPSQRIEAALEGASEGNEAGE